MSALFEEKNTDEGISTVVQDWSVSPFDLVGCNGFHNELKPQSCFCWRWFKRGGEKFRLLTIEDANFGGFKKKNQTNKYNPLNLIGINGYNDQLNTKTNFCWRWYKRDNNRFRVVTLEDSKETKNQLNQVLLPQHLRPVNNYEQEAGKLKFCWRWFKRDSTDFRVITLEQEVMKQTSDDIESKDEGMTQIVEDWSVSPFDFVGCNGFHDNLKAQSCFCWRWFKRGDSKFRVVTIEDTNYGGFKDKSIKNIYNPLNLIGINGYRDDLKNKTLFCWRWYKRDNNSFRVVTLEDVNVSIDFKETKYKYNEVLLPGHLRPVNGYEAEAKQFKFCWRWFKRDGTDFRVLTLE